MNHPHAGCACPREGNTGWQGRTEHDKTGAGMPQPWNDKVHAVRTRLGFQTFPRVRRVLGGGIGLGWDGMDGSGEGPEHTQGGSPHVFRGLGGFLSWPLHATGYGAATAGTRRS